MFFHLSFIVGTIVRICLQYLLLVVRVVHRMRPQKPKRSVTTGHQRHCSPSPVIARRFYFQARGETMPKRAIHPLHHDW